MRGHTVIDVREVNQITTITDSRKTPGASAFEDRRHKVCIARTPDQVRPQCHRAQRCRIARSKHLSLSDRFRLRIKRMVVSRVWIALVDSFETFTIVNNTRRARVHYVANPCVLARPDNVSRTNNIRPKKIVIRAPHVNFGCGMKNPRGTLQNVRPF
jgi:hypothetical protein